MIDEIMDVKFPIHSRRIEVLNPSILSNEEAPSFLMRMLVIFTDAKMAQAHWQNILIHLLLKHLPENEVFKKQRDWLSNYLSEISTNRGATSKADLRYVETNLLRIEADLISKNKPTCQALQSGRNRRTFNGEEKNEDRAYK